MKSFKAWVLCLALVSIGALSASARAEDLPYTPVPGNMGPIAIPTIPTRDPVVGDEIYVELAWVNHFSNYGDYSGAPYFRIVLPLAQVVALEFEGTPLEVWEQSEATNRDWGNPDRSGVNAGDISFGATAHLVREREKLPAIGVRFLVRTATGNNTENRRFLDAPAYVIELLLGKDIFKGEGFIKRIRALAKVGFMAYQQGWARQNDAFDYGLAFQFFFDHGIRVDVEWRGYVGYQGGDSPSELAVRLTFEGRHVDFFIGGAMGLFGGAPDWELLAGIAVHFQAPKLPWIE